DYLCVKATDDFANTGYHLVGKLNVDATAPGLAFVTNVSATTTDRTPNYTFSSTEAGTISYGGSCASATIAAVVGVNTITLGLPTAGTANLALGTHADC